MDGDFVDTRTYDMNRIKSLFRPWTSKDGEIRYYINDATHLIESEHDYYDWGEMRASGGRVWNIIIGNIMPKTKVFIDIDGHLHVYGWACHGQGEAMELPKVIANAVWKEYGIADERVREMRAKKLVGHSAHNQYTDVGDVVKIVRGRKSVGMVFTITRVTYYHYSQYAKPSVYLYDDTQDFKVNAENCEIVDVGFSTKIKY